MRIQRYANLEEAENHVIGFEKGFYIERHRLKPNESIDYHFHSKANEWIVLGQGTFELSTDFQRRTFNIDSGAGLMRLPAQSVHSLRPTSLLVYRVYRDILADETIWLKDLIRKIYTEKPQEDPCGLRWQLYDGDNLSLGYFKITGTAKEHKHEKTHETYFVKSGNGQLMVGDRVIKISEGQAFKIPLHTNHFLRIGQDQEPLEVLVLNHPRFDPSDFIPI